MKTTTPRGEVGFEARGDGEAVVLLHPLAMSGAFWSPLAQHLSTSFRTLAVDARGHGESSWDGAPFSVEDMADDVAALLDTLSIRPAGVIGMSMGGTTALTLAGRRPDLVPRLVLADTTASYGPDRIPQWEERAVKALEVPRPQQLPFQVDRWFSSEFVEASPDEVQRVADLFLATSSSAHAAACRALGGADATAVLPRIEASTLVVVGEDDYATPVSMAQEISRGVPGADLHVLRGARHAALLEQPSSWDLVSRHLTSSTRPGGSVVS